MAWHILPCQAVSLKRFLLERINKMAIPTRDERERKEKRLRNAMTSCIIADIATAIYLILTIFYYSSYSWNDMPFAAVLCLVSWIATWFVSFQLKKNGF